MGRTWLACTRKFGPRHFELCPIGFISTVIDSQTERGSSTVQKCGLSPQNLRVSYWNVRMYVALDERTKDKLALYYGSSSVNIVTSSCGIIAICLAYSSMEMTFRILVAMEIGMTKAVLPDADRQGIIAVSSPRSCRTLLHIRSQIRLPYTLVGTSIGRCTQCVSQPLSFLIH